MIHHNLLVEPVGSDPLGPFSPADLTSAQGRLGGVLLRPLPGVEAGAQDFHSSVLVFILAALVLTLCHQTRRQVRNADGALGFIHMLASGAAGAVGVYAQVLRGDVKLRLLRLGQHGHGGGGGMDAPAALRLRNTLDTVGTSLKLQPGIDPGPLYGESGLLHTA